MVLSGAYRCVCVCGVVVFVVAAAVAVVLQVLWFPPHPLPPSWINGYS